jgi:hypothetical protein
MDEKNKIADAQRLIFDGINSLKAAFPKKEFSIDGRLVGDIDEFSTEGVIFQIGVIPRRIDIITKIDGVSYEEADEDKIIVEIEELKIPVISLEKFIKNKMATGREKGELDIKTLMKKKNS